MGLEKRGWSVIVAARKVDRPRCEALADSLHWNIEVKQIPASHRTHRWQRIGFVFTRLWATGGLRHMFSPWVRDLVLASEGFDHICSEIKPDLIHAHFGPNGIIAALAARHSNIPLIVDFHGYDVTTIPRRHGWGAYRRWLSHATAIVHSSFVQRLVEAHLPCRIARVHLGVDTDVFSAPERADHWPQEIGFLFVGRLVYQKGVHVALGMMAIFRKHFPQYGAHLTICGDGPDLDFFRLCAREFGVEAYVTFIGAVSGAEVAARMRAADILLIPSVPVVSGAEEAFCRVAIEGMAMKMAVIGSRTGGLEETIGTGGHTFRAGSAMGLFGEVKKILDGSNPRQEGERAGDRARQFTIGRMDDEYAAIIDQSMSV